MKESKKQIDDRVQQNIRDHLEWLKNRKEKGRRKINEIILHCSDSDNPKHDNVETITKWHTERGWSGPDGISGNEDDIGYHFVITKDGAFHEGRDVEEIGAHCIGHNKNSIGICLTGSKEFSEAQFYSLRLGLEILFKKYYLNWDNVKPHNFYDKGKTCPNFTLQQIKKIRLEE